MSTPLPQEMLCLWFAIAEQAILCFLGQHAFHTDCLGRKVMEQVGVGKSKRIREVQKLVSTGIVVGARRRCCDCRVGCLGCFGLVSLLVPLRVAESTHLE